MAYGDGTSNVMCYCNQTWGIGLPFDHPIWQQITYCPMHSTLTNNGYATNWNWCWTHEWRGRHAAVRVCKNCGVDETWSGKFDGGLQTITSQPYDPNTTTVRWDAISELAYSQWPTFVEDI